MGPAYRPIRAGRYISGLFGLAPPTNVLSATDGIRRLPQALCRRILQRGGLYCPCSLSNAALISSNRIKRSVTLLNQSSCWRCRDQTEGLCPTLGHDLVRTNNNVMRDCIYSNRQLLVTLSCTGTTI